MSWKMLTIIILGAITGIGLIALGIILWRLKKLIDKEHLYRD